MATTYRVDTNDKRLTAIEDKQAADIKESDASFDKMLADTKTEYNNAMSKWDTWEDTQTDLQNRRHEQTIKEIEQKKADLKSDYTKEQSGAYVDWQKQSDEYGVNAEKAAASGMSNSGFTANFETSLYNTYQNRVAAARESYMRSLTNYENNINQAKLNNDTILAEIAAEAAQNQMQLSLQLLTAKNNLLTQKAEANLRIKSNWQSVYQNMMDTIMSEHRLNEDARQADMANKRAQESIKIAQAELKIKQEQWEQEKADKEAARIAAAKAAEAKANASRKGTSYSRNSYVKKQTNDERKIQKADAKVTPKVSAKDALNKLIAQGASKDVVSNRISLALREGEITKAEAAKLRQTFTPRGVAY